jgi:bacterioferritin-associated ferredoxin
VADGERADRGDLVVCRCEDVRAREVEHAVTVLGCRSPNEVKKLTRAGMGPCQGKVCHRLVQLALLRHAGGEAAGVPLLVRPPVRPIPLAQLARLAEDLDEPAGTLNADVIWGVSKGARGTVPLEPVEPPEKARP